MTPGIPWCFHETVMMVKLGPGVHGGLYRMLVPMPRGWDDVRVRNCVVEAWPKDGVVFAAVAGSAADRRNAEEPAEGLDDLTEETTEGPATGGADPIVVWTLCVDGLVVAGSDSRGMCVVDHRVWVLVDAVFFNPGADLDLALRVTFLCSKPSKPKPPGSIYLFPPPRWVTRLQVWFGSRFWRSP